MSVWPAFTLQTVPKVSERLGGHPVRESLRVLGRKNRSPPRSRRLSASTPKAILILPLMFAVPALADPLSFYKSDAEAGELEPARYACMRQSLQPSGEAAVWLFIACIRAQGWHLIEQPPTPQR